MTTTPRSERVHITLFGLRNAGKSSLLNAIAGKSAAIVSPEPGTTTDPVSLPMEFGGLGPVVLTDTAGLDDEGELGRLRVERSLERLSWTDIALLATPLDRPPAEAEEAALRRLRAAGRILVVVGTFADRVAHPEKEAWLARLEGAEGPGAPRAVLRASGPSGEGLPELRAFLAGLGAGQAGKGGADGGDSEGGIAGDGDTEAAGPRAAGAGLGEKGPLEGLIGPGDLVLLVTPIDSAAPKGRLILPQAELLRDALDRGALALVSRETELAAAWAALARPPKLVVTDSQAFGKVAALLPPEQPLSSFSILFARKKGELARFAPGLRRLEALAATRPEKAEAAPPLRLLAIEACAHNRTHEDIATVKIPRLLEERTGRRVELRVARELSDAAVDSGYDLAVTCGGCMATRAKMLAQLGALEDAGVPALNFGLFLAWAQGVFPRAIRPLGLETL